MRKGIGAALVAIFILASALPAAAEPWWQRRIDKLARGHSIGISVGDRKHIVYEHAGARKRTPASNEKLLLSMALFATLGPDKRIHTTAVARRSQGGVIKGNLWILGHGDPAITGGARFGRTLGYRPTTLHSLVAGIKRSGVRRITGRVRGSRSYFTHDWWAPGWRSFFPTEEVALPSALTFEGNVHKKRMTPHPERLLARSLTRKLQEAGVAVGGKPGSGVAPRGLRVVAQVRSAPLSHITRFMDRHSVNFFAEVLGKLLGAKKRGRPGTISKGAGALRAWAATHDVGIVAHDSSGLSYANRVATNGIVRLLNLSMSRPWYRVLRRGLARGGEGTLEDRLGGVRLRAKTGTLEDISALSGWVWVGNNQRWVPFSILSSGMSKDKASDIEDRIVRILARSAHVPAPGSGASSTTALGGVDFGSWLALSYQSVLASAQSHSTSASVASS